NSSAASDVYKRQGIPWILGGDADLSTSTKTGVAEAPDFDGRTGAGRNIHFGVREHAMAGIANGIAYHGGAHPYVATFFAFSDYMRPALRLAALSQLPVSWVWTHDSIGLGEDGPTHQPIEQLMSIRAIPNVWLVRPADANETREAWKLAIQRTGGPTGLVLTRQNVPVLDRSAGGGGAEGVERGAYVLAEADPAPARAIVLATGSEVAVALEGREILRKEGIGVRVVSMPCWEAFEAQTQAYRDSVLPPSIDARVSVEAGATLGWSRWIGSRGVAIGIDRFGSSAPGEVNMERLGFTGERVASAVRGLLGASSPAGGQRSAPANQRGER
ncbi:MAG: transketolase C-terminal domain-containing protein, partial [Candidatus Eisenbacteria bacterium]|nr:transketolase C-terminal domain-containing protein [Candidatus Eisenbacteria bacterium]